MITRSYIEGVWPVKGRRNGGVIRWRVEGVVACSKCRVTLTLWSPHNIYHSGGSSIRPPHLEKNKERGIGGERERDVYALVLSGNDVQLFNGFLFMVTHVVTMR